MFETKPGQLRRVAQGALLLLAAAACKSGAPPKPEQAFPCKRMALGDPGPTEYQCPDAVTAQLCAQQSVVACRPTNRVRGTVAPGSACRRGTWDPEAKVYELGDSCAPNPRFASEDTPKGSVCVKVPGEGGAYCTHDCQTPEDCADVVSTGYLADCRGGGCFLVPK